MWRSSTPYSRALSVRLGARKPSTQWLPTWWWLSTTRVRRRRGYRMHGRPDPSKRPRVHSSANSQRPRQRRLWRRPESGTLLTVSSDYHLISQSGMSFSKKTLVLEVLRYLDEHAEVAMLVPQGFDPQNEYARLSKRHPSLLVLLLRALAVRSSDGPARPARGEVYLRRRVAVRCAEVDHARERLLHAVPEHTLKKSERVRRTLLPIL